MLDQLFDLATQTNPALKGEPGFGSPLMIRPGQDNHKQIAGVYQDLQALHPKAGVAYFRARTWVLLCWQPIYLSLISIYGLKVLPKGLMYLAQKRLPGLVCGFNLPAMGFIQAEQMNLIEEACRQIRALIDEIQRQFIEVSDARKGVLDRLFIDVFLETLLTVYSLFESSKLVDIRHEADQWLLGFGFEQNASRAISSNCLEGHAHVKCFYLNRISCCMHYRRDDGDLCVNCPKLIKSKQKSSTLRDGYV
ncbi:MAG: siderophore ferric iron reductase [Pseudohongiellaceae bacterium]